MRETNLILSDINALVRSKGYIYALCMLILEDFHYDIEHVHEVNYKDHLGVQEISLLVGFLLHEPIDFSYPTHPTALLSLKKSSLELLNELEQALIQENHQTIQKSIHKGHTSKEAEIKQLNFFVKEGSIVEPIIYSGNGTRLYPYDQILEKKYKNDNNWLSQHCGFTIPQALLIIERIQNKLHKKFKHFYSFMLKSKRNRSAYFENCPDGWQCHFYPYLDLFNKNESSDNQSDISKMTESNWSCFYKNLIDLFTLHRDDFGYEPYVTSFLEKFTTDQVSEYNEQYNTVGDYNYYRTQPILLLEPQGKHFFIPLSFMLYEILYEAPLEWMVEDKEYRATALENTALFGNNLTYKLISNVYYENQIYRNATVQLPSGEKQIIDLLCIIANKALCIQIKSDRLSELSRYNNNKEVLLEFKRAIQEIYDKGNLKRKMLLDPQSQLLNDNGQNIILEQPIDEVYMMGVTSKNYPTITHQAHLFLNKKEEDPYPVFTTIFELDILLHYLKTPFTLLYYLRQRSKLTNYFIASEELAYLGYHIINRLHKIPDTQEFFISDEYAELIDRNYYPFKFGVDKWIDETNDPIKNRWHNSWFNRICKQIKKSNNPNRVDILFHLYNLRPKSIDRIVGAMKDLKEQAKRDKDTIHTSVYMTTESIGLSYFVVPDENRIELSQKLTEFCNIQKYKYKADFWLGIGSFAYSNQPYDLLIYNKDSWVYNKELKKKSKKYNS